MLEGILFFRSGWDKVETWAGWGGHRSPRPRVDRRDHNGSIENCNDLAGQSEKVCVRLSILIIHNNTGDPRKKDGGKKRRRIFHSPEAVGKKVETEVQHNLSLPA